MRIPSIALLVASLAIPAVAEDTSSSGTTEENAVERAVPSVTVTTAEIAEVQARVPVVGTLVARQEVQIYPQVSGHEITELLVEAGDSVEKGQVLARLSTDTLAAQLAQAEAGYQQAEAALKQADTALRRAQRLRDTNNASQAALDDAIAAQANAQAGLAQAEAARRIARLDLNRAAIIAPVSGLVVERNAMLGALSGGSSGPLFILLAGGEVEMSAEVIETALPRLSIGAPAEIEVAGLGKIDGQVRLVPASVDPVTRLGKMRISLKAAPGLRTGLFASGSVIAAKRDAVTVPATAVLSDDQGERVQVVEDGVVRSREVRAGLLWEGRREILEGVAEGEQVIARSGAFFRDGDMVKAVSAARSGEETEDETASAAAEGTRRP
ncbi:efflux RND transporter periplasmic adaptor subunit [Paracoccus alkanivorans]|uniref:Efflux RND transporter periplasmic adaptor subunit n=1 Tax=Paracoccus alkanivorans TaxID=2116655 RepID=A0A3M0N1X1_9RHOB|nr:efflux RND transporter periplasmic adaptor subunit [Paracoccus alkanivorans]RMC37707.1 efflux RND transporter periplasmic adaptor subunit [Paracoccus alkanivorans]